jgi:lysophospholipase L1-like esterase
MRAARSVLVTVLLAVGAATLVGCGQQPPTTAPAAVGKATAHATHKAKHTTKPTAKPVPRIKSIVLPAHPRVYFFGDSWTNGASAAPGRGFPHVTAEALGWQAVQGPDNSGAGFVHTYNPAHPVFPEKVRSLGRIHADLVVIEGGVNDVPGPLGQYWNVVKGTIQQLQKKAGGAPVVLVGPVYPNGTVPSALGAMDFLDKGVAGQLGIPYVSPISEGWFNPTNVRTLIDQETMHPNTAGHAYYGARLAADLRLLTTTKAK